jgi:hypothetical protein
MTGDVRMMAVTRRAVRQARRSQQCRTTAPSFEDRGAVKGEDGKVGPVTAQ